MADEPTPAAEPTRTPIDGTWVYLGRRMNREGKLAQVLAPLESVKAGTPNELWFKDGIVSCPVGAQLAGDGVAKVYHPTAGRLLYTRRVLRKPLRRDRHECAQCRSPMEPGTEAWGDAAGTSAVRYERVCCTCMADLLCLGLG